MPIVSPAGGIWQVRLIGEQDGQSVVNVLHFLTPQGASDVDAQLILIIINCWLTHMKPVTSSAYTFKEVRYQLVSVNPPGVEQIHTVTGGQGSGSAVALPSFASGVVALRGLIGGRSGAGRFSVAGIPESATLNSLFDTSNAYWTAFLAFVACLASAFVKVPPFAANDYQWIIYSKKLGGANYPFTVAGATGVVTATPRTQIGTINSRKIGRGA